MRRTISQKIVCIIVAFLFFINDICFGLGIQPLSTVPGGQARGYEELMKHLTAARDSSIVPDIFIGSEFILDPTTGSRSPLMKDVNFIKNVDPNTIPEEWLRSSFFRNLDRMRDEHGKIDISKALTCYMTEEAGLPEGMIEFKRGYIEVDEKSGVIPIEYVMEVPEGGGVKLEGIVDTRFEQRWDDVLAHDVRFSYKFSDGETRIISAAWALFFSLAEHIMTDLKKEDLKQGIITPKGSGRGHFTLGQKEPHRNEYLANMRDGRYWLPDEAVRLWFDEIFCLDNKRRRNNNECLRRIEWFFKSEESKRLGLPEEFPKLLEDEQAREVAIQLVHAINYNYFSRLGIKVIEPVADPALRAEAKERLAARKAAGITTPPIFAAGADGRKELYRYEDMTDEEAFRHLDLKPAEGLVALANLKSLVKYIKYLPPAQISITMDGLERNFIFSTTINDPALAAKQRRAWHELANQIFLREGWTHVPHSKAYIKRKPGQSDNDFKSELTLGFIRYNYPYEVRISGIMKDFGIGPENNDLVPDVIRKEGYEKVPQAECGVNDLYRRKIAKELEEAVKTILSDELFRQLSPSLKTENGGSSVIITVTNPSDPKESKGFKLRAGNPGAEVRRHLSIVPLNNGDLVQGEEKHCGEVFQLRDLAKDALIAIKKYSWLGEWIAAAQTTNPIRQSRVIFNRKANILYITLQGGIADGVFAEVNLNDNQAKIHETNGGPVLRNDTEKWADAARRIKEEVKSARQAIERKNQAQAPAVAGYLGRFSVPEQTLITGLIPENCQDKQVVAQFLAKARAAENDADVNAAVMELASYVGFDIAAKLVRQARALGMGLAMFGGPSESDKRGQPPAEQAAEAPAAKIQNHTARYISMSIPQLRTKLQTLANAITKLELHSRSITKELQGGTNPERARALKQKQAKLEKLISGLEERERIAAKELARKEHTYITPEGLEPNGRGEPAGPREGDGQESAPTPDTAAIILAAKATADASAPLAKIAQTGPDAMVSIVMNDKALVGKLMATGNWDGENDLRRTLRNVAFGQKTDDVIESARQLVAIMESQDPGTVPELIVASTLMERRINAPAFMEITDELLRRVDAALAENLEGLLSKDPDIQKKSFQWLFDRLITEATALVNVPPEGKRPHALIAKIIMKQINIVLSNTNESNWFNLRNEIVMRFAREMQAEVVKEKQPLIAALMACYPDVTEDFLFAVDKNFVIFAKNYEEKEYETFCQAVETLLSFACLVWADRFFDYLKSHYAHATNFIKAHYLWSMKFGLNTAKQPDGAKEIVKDERLEFVISNAVDLCVDKDERVKSKCASVLTDLGEYFIQYLEDGEKYARLDKARRKVIIDVLLRLGINGAVKGGKARVLPFVMHELEQADNAEIQSQIYIFKYFTDDFITTLSPEHGKRIRKSIISNYSELKNNDVAGKNCRRIMVRFGFPAIIETFDFFNEKLGINYKLAVDILLLSAETASVYQTDKPEEISAIRDIVKKVAGLAKRAGEEKVGLIADYFKLQEEISKKKGEIDNLRIQAAISETAIGGINKEVEEVRSRIGEIRRDRGGFVKNKDLLVNVLRQLYITVDAGSGFFGALKRLVKAASGIIGKKKTAIPGNLTEADIMGRPLSRGESMAMKGELAQRRAELAEIMGHLGALDAELKELNKKLAEEEQKQVTIAEELSLIKTRCAEMEKFINVGEEKGRNEAYARVAEKARFTKDVCRAARLFLKGQAIDTDTAQNVYNKLNPEEAQSIITRLAIATDTRLGPAIGPQETEGALLKFIPVQSAYSIYRQDILDEIDFLRELWVAGLYMPSPDNPLFKLLTTSIRDTVRQPGQLQKLEMLAGSQEKAKNHAYGVFKKLIEEILSVTGAAADSLIDAFGAFLKFKFKVPEDKCVLENMATRKLMITFVYAVFNPEIGPAKALDLLFFELSGGSGKYFLQPEAQEIERPVNKAQVIEKRYRTYFREATQLKDTIYRTDREMARVTTGFGWDEEANNATLYLLKTLFSQNNTPQEVRAYTEGVMVNVFLLWLEKWMATENTKDVNIASNAVIKNISDYLAAAPAVDPKDLDDRTLTHNPRFVLMLCHEFAKRMDRISEKILVQDARNIVAILERMEQIIPYELIVKENNTEVRLLVLIKDTLEKLRKRVTKLEPKPAKETPWLPRPQKAPGGLALPFTAKVPSKPALPSSAGENGRPRDKETGPQRGDVASLITEMKEGDQERQCTFNDLFNALESFYMSVGKNLESLKEEKTKAALIIANFYRARRKEEPIKQFSEISEREDIINHTRLDLLYSEDFVSGKDASGRSYLVDLHQHTIDLFIGLAWERGWIRDVKVSGNVKDTLQRYIEEIDRLDLSRREKANAAANIIKNTLEWVHDGNIKVREIVLPDNLQVHPATLFLVRGHRSDRGITYLSKYRDPSTGEIKELTDNEKAALIAEEAVSCRVTHNLGERLWNGLNDVIAGRPSQSAESLDDTLHYIGNFFFKHPEVMRADIAHAEPAVDMNLLVDQAEALARDAIRNNHEVFSIANIIEGLSSSENSRDIARRLKDELHERGFRPRAGFSIAITMEKRKELRRKIDAEDAVHKPDRKQGPVASQAQQRVVANADKDELFDICKALASLPDNTVVDYKYLKGMVTKCGITVPEAGQILDIAADKLEPKGNQSRWKITEKSRAILNRAMSTFKPGQIKGLDVIRQAAQDAKKEAEQRPAAALEEINARQSLEKKPDAGAPTVTRDTSLSFSQTPAESNNVTTQRVIGPARITPSVKPQAKAPIMPFDKVISALIKAVEERRDICIVVPDDLFTNTDLTGYSSILSIRFKLPDSAFYSLSRGAIEIPPAYSGDGREFREALLYDYINTSIKEGESRFDASELSVKFELDIDSPIKILKTSVFGLIWHPAIPNVFRKREAVTPQASAGFSGSMPRPTGARVAAARRWIWGRVKAGQTKFSNLHRMPEGFGLSEGEWEAIFKEGVEDIRFIRDGKYYVVSVSPRDSEPREWQPDQQTEQGPDAYSPIDLVLLTSRELQNRSSRGDDYVEVDRLPMDIFVAMGLANIGEIYFRDGAFYRAGSKVSESPSRASTDKEALIRLTINKIEHEGGAYIEVIEEGTNLKLLFTHEQAIEYAKSRQLVFRDGRFYFMGGGVAYKAPQDEQPDEGSASPASEPAVETKGLTVEGLCKEFDAAFRSYRRVLEQPFTDEGQAALNRLSQIRDRYKPLLESKPKLPFPFAFQISYLQVYYDHNYAPLMKNVDRLARMRNDRTANGILHDPVFLELCITAMVLNHESVAEACRSRKPFIEYYADRIFGADKGHIEMTRAYGDLKTYITRMAVISQVSGIDLALLYERKGRYDDAFKAIDNTILLLANDNALLSADETSLDEEKLALLKLRGDMIANPGLFPLTEKDIADLLMLMGKKIPGETNPEKVTDETIEELLALRSKIMMEKEDAKFVEVHEANKAALAGYAVIKVISEWAINPGKSESREPTLAVGELSDIYKSIGLLRNEQIEIIMPEEIGVSDNTKRAILDINNNHREQVRHTGKGEERDIVNYRLYSDEEDLRKMLKTPPASGVKRILITDKQFKDDDARKVYAEQLSKDLAISNDTRLLDILLPEDYSAMAKDSDKRTFHQLRLIMIAALGCTIKPDNAVGKLILTNMLNDYVLNGNAADFVENLAESGNSWTTDKLSYFLGKTVRLSEELIKEQELLKLRMTTFYIAA